MKVNINLAAGSNNQNIVYKNDIQKNIDALDRYIKCKQTCGDFVLLVDAKSILEEIKNQLPESVY